MCSKSSVECFDTEENRISSVFDCSSHHFRASGGSKYFRSGGARCERHGQEARTARDVERAVGGADDCDWVRIGMKTDLIETEVHPGHDAFEAETKMLEGDWQDSIPFPVRLVSYDQI